MARLLRAVRWLQKRGNRVQEFEDAYAFVQGSDWLENDFRIAIADGATESSFASEWAKLLVRSYRDQAFADIEDLRKRVEILSQRWRQVVNRHNLPWFAEEKARRGAFSAFLGLELYKTTTNSIGSWRAVAVGDSCLFHLRNGILLQSFPFDLSEQFSSTPVLISSNQSMNIDVWSRVQFCEGDWQIGDEFILATDALSSWLLSQHEQGQQPWIEICELLLRKPKESFQQWIDEKRALTMRNDDTTCIVILVED